jgi:two-component system, sensor histidine kinase and response regulator
MENPGKVLIVDDMPQNIQIAGAFLMQAGFEPAFAQSGTEALDAANTYDYDVILLDIMMPGMNGYEVCEKLKQNPKTRDIPVIFLTALREIENIKRAFQAGGVDFITKPFNSDELVARTIAQLQLKRQREELQKLNSLKDKLFSIVAHDLKHPFNALLSLTEALMNNYKEFDYDTLGQYLQMLYESAQQGYQLLENLLEWSHTQTNKIKYSPVKIRLPELLENVLQLEKFIADQKSVKLISVVEDVNVWADYNMLNTVLRNLITNAIKFSHPGSDIYIESTMTENNMIQISITDQGVGIEPENIDKLFRSDIHFTTYGTSNEKGTGLGLILCKEFVERNGGSITVESKLGKGSSFKFTLPCMEVIVDQN